MDGGSGSDGGRDVDDEQQRSSNLMLWFSWWCCWLAPGDSKRRQGRRTDAARLDDACGGVRCSLVYWSSGRRRPGPAVLRGEATAGEAPPLCSAVLQTKKPAVRAACSGDNSMRQIELSSTTAVCSSDLDHNIDVTKKQGRGQHASSRAQRSSVLYLYRGTTRKRRRD
jgi:hypothetical protein